MKIHKQILCAAIVAGAALAATNSSQALVTNDGDILIGFSLNTVTAHDTYVFTLGQASVLRENTSSFLSLGNIGTDLTNTFGANWWNNTNLRWGIIGGVTAGVINGDPSNTVYESKARTAIGTQSSAPVTTGGNHGTLSLNMGGFRDGTETTPGTPGSNVSGAIINTSSATDFNQYIPPQSGATYFGIGLNLTQSFTAGDFGTGTGGYSAEGVVDLWRILNTTSGADLTSGLGSGNAIARTGQFVGAITIDNAGELRLDVAAVPEPSTFGLLGMAAVGLATLRRRRKTA